MEMDSFNIGQHIINSFNDIVDYDGLLDVKSFASDDQTFFAASPGSNQKKESAFSQLINFGSKDSPLLDSHNLLLEDAMCNMDTQIAKRDPSQAQNHVAAERRRREKLTQLFISLSKILPGLKKLDKASLLGDAIDYMKQLQERVSILEEETNTNSNFLDPTGTTLVADQDKSPIQEIKVKISRPTILIKLHCNKEDGLVQRLLGEVGKLHVSVLDFRVIPFGTNTLDITILAEMENGFRSTVEDVEKQLEMAIPNPQDKPNTYADLQEFCYLSELEA